MMQEGLVQAYTQGFELDLHSLYERAEAMAKGTSENTLMCALSMVQFEVAKEYEKRKKESAGGDKSQTSGTKADGGVDAKNNRVGETSESAVPKSAAVEIMTAKFIKKQIALNDDLIARVKELERTRISWE